MNDRHRDGLQSRICRNSLIPGPRINAPPQPRGTAAGANLIPRDPLQQGDGCIPRG